MIRPVSTGGWRPTCAAESAVMTNVFSPTFPGPYDLSLTDSSFGIISAMPFALAMTIQPK